MTDFLIYFEQQQLNGWIYYGHIRRACIFKVVDIMYITFTEWATELIKLLSEVFFVINRIILSAPWFPFCDITPTWHLYGFLENAPFLLPDWFVGTLYFLALYSSTLGGLVLWLSGRDVTLWLDHTQPAVLQGLLQKGRSKRHSLKSLPVNDVFSVIK